MSALPPFLAGALRQGESETVEFKRSFGEETLRCPCALANAAGCEVWVGIDDDGEIVGVTLGRQSLRDWSNVTDDYPIYGTLWDQVEGAMAYFGQHLQTGYGSTPEAAREVIWEYPLEGLREAIIDAQPPGLHRPQACAGAVV